MKRFLTLAMVFTLSLSALAQQKGSVALNAYGGYNFRDRVNFDGFYGYIDEAFQYGGGLEYYLHSTKSLELKYLRMDTRMPLYGPAGSKLNDDAEDGSISYILVGGNNYFGKSSTAKAMAFAGGDLGVGIVNMDKGGSATKFAWDAKVGVRINTSSAISLKFHAYVQSIIAAVGSDFYYTWTGVVIGVPDYASIFQFGLGGAICFNFKSKK
ncbi:MAG TPA: hypothetical protein VFZ42_07775 [Chitinophagaceae bacterium]